MDDEPERRIDRCPTCGLVDFEYIAEDVVQCRNCTYLWVRAPDEDGTPPPTS
ncbi:MAG: hypothetical protein KDC36_00175 [Thermoleophilia bacterium]|nr:hypothetical protein [Thermoleophilia bacterium]